MTLSKYNCSVNLYGKTKKVFKDFISIGITHVENATSLNAAAGATKKPERQIPLSGNPHQVLAPQRTGEAVHASGSVACESACWGGSLC